MNALGEILSAKVKDTDRGKRLAHRHHGVRVCVHHNLSRNVSNTYVGGAIRIQYENVNLKSRVYLIFGSGQEAQLL